MIDLSTILGPPPTPDPDSDIARLIMARKLEIDFSYRRVFGTRELARKVASKLPASSEVELDCSRVEVVSTPFIHELLIHRPGVRFRMMNQDVAASLALVLERM